MRRIESECDALLIGSTAMKMWWPHFRAPKDADLWVKPGYVERFLKANPNFKTVKRTNRKLYGTVNGKTIDLTIDCDGSWIGYTLKANRAGKQLPFHNTTVTLAKPTTLRLIKEVLSCWRQQWQKNIRDYIFLSTAVEGAYSQEEWEAYFVAMDNFQRIFKDDGIPVSLPPYKYTIDELQGTINIADLKSRIMIKDKILEYL